MSEIKPCPYCRSEIAEAAIKCPVCQSSLAKKTPLQRLLGLRDYVTFPTAVLALVAAVYTPLVAPVRAFLGLDGANVEAFFLSPEMLAADKPDAERPAMRMSVSNTGSSVAVLLNNFVCAGDRFEEKNEIVTFSFVDPESLKPLYPEIEAGSSKQLFAEIAHADTYTDAAWNIAGNNRCDLAWSDKHGSGTYTFDFDARSEEAVRDILN